MGKTIVIDANVTLSLVLRLPYSEKVDRWMQAWQLEEAHLVVPTLWEYECLSGLRKAVTLKMISSHDAERIAADLLALDFQRVAPTLALHKSALRWADHLGQSKVYDAQYVALAESLSAEFWTVDQRLGNSLQGLRVDWAHSE
ncbi:MAG TPA: type II toxin-antitoxin system VapC family toxin [Anaerolineaceae bacterium]|nr:type II toxin-antitoxin system VapC family toxin [Anaerolineaceae bacterium]